MRLKPGVRMRTVLPQLVIGMMVLDAVYKNVTGADMVVTSITDGQHSSKSQHWLGGAFDSRTKLANIPRDTAEQIAAESRAQLGPDWDIVVEDDHIHSEYDPKGRP